MKTNRLVALLLMVTMLLSALGSALAADLSEIGFNAEGFPIVSQPLTMTVFGSRDQNQAEWKDVLVLQKYAEMTGIQMDYQEVPAQGFAEKKALMFAGNDLPDIFLRCAITPEEVTNYGVYSKQLLPLEDLIAQYAPNLTAVLDANPLFKKLMTAPDGHIYVIPPMDASDTARMDFKQWINKEWLEKLGLEMPTTLEEFKQVLIAFRDGDPNGNGEKDEIPLGIREPSSVYQLGGAFGLQYQLRSTFNADAEGNIHNWLCDDAFKAYLEYLHDLYAEGLLWQEYFKNDRPLWRSNLSQALFGAFYMPYSDVFLAVEDQFTGYEPLIGPAGVKLWGDANSGIDANGGFAISNTCKYPEAAVRWIDYFFSQEGALFYFYGIEGETYTMDETGTPRFTDEILNAPEGFMTALGKINLVPGGGFPAYKTNLTQGTVASDLCKEVASLLVPYLPEVVYAKPTVSTEDMDRLSAILQDLEPYRDGAVTKFITGEWGFDKWDEYCNTMKQIGVYEVEEIYQRALSELLK